MISDEDLCLSSSEARKQARFRCAMKVPKSAEDVAHSIIYYGEFYEAFEYMLETFKSRIPPSIIVHGPSGCGKKTLIKQAQSFFGVKSIYFEFDPQKLDKDYFCQLAQGLNWDVLPESIAEDNLIEDLLAILEIRVGKFVIVLANFEKFCSQKQNLLYSLTNMTQQVFNLSIIGLTSRLDCTNNLDEPTRSHLNAVSCELLPPYRCKQEYVEFASLLLCRDLSSESRVKRSLERIYINTKSIENLKSYLLSICSWSDTGELIMNLQAGSTLVPGCDLTYLEQCLASLSRLQLKMLKIAVSYCNALETCKFTLRDLDVDPSPREVDHVLEKKHKQFLKDASALVFRGLFIPSTISSLERVKLENKQSRPREKSNLEISLETEFTIGVPPLEMKVVDEWKSKRSDPCEENLWKRRHI